MTRPTLAAAAALVGALAVGSSSAAVSVPATPREFRGVWVATVRNIDWPLSRTLTTAQQQAALTAVFDRAQANNMNAVVLQVRPCCDALYESSIEPWSRWLTNSEGTAPNPPWDPLAFAVQAAHDRGLELHAWVNPYRARNTTAYTHAPSHIALVSPEVVYDYGSDQWLDPGLPQVQDHSVRVIRDIVNRYNIDALHIDDYFYPYPTGSPFPDSATYAAYTASGGTLSLGDWRRNNVNVFVQRLWSEIHATKPWVRFGISPFGTWKPDFPPGQAGSFNAYESIYADSRLWLQQGWCDYFAPQLYWRPSTASPNFNAVLDWWIAQNTAGRHIFSGLFTASITYGTGGWTTGDIVTEIQATEARAGASGHIHYSDRQFAVTSPSISAALLATTNAAQALPPAYPWLDATPPAPPVVQPLSGTGDGPTTVTWANGDAEEPRLFVVHVQRGAAWTHIILPGSAHTCQIPLVAGTAPTAVAVSAVDRVNNESSATLAATLPVGMTMLGSP